VLYSLPLSILLPVGTKVLDFELKITWNVTYFDTFKLLACSKFSWMFIMLALNVVH
jgi:hypothetical protein